jgi:putative nucleotidyltransferase with HDIG domain
MSWLKKVRARLAGTAEIRRTRKTGEQSAVLSTLENSPVVAAGIFIATVGLIVLISFVGVSSIALPVQPNQLATVRIVATEPFSYESPLRTQEMVEQLRNRVPPVFRLEFAPYEQFVLHLGDLRLALEEFERRHLPEDPAARPAAVAANRAELAEIVEAFNARGPYRASVDDVATFLLSGDSRLRFALLENGLVTLRELYQEGIYDDTTELVGSRPGSVSVYEIRRPDGEVARTRVQSREEALTFLRINVNAEGLSAAASSALYRLLRNGLTTNLIFDAAATEELRQRVATDMRPVVVEVQRGQTIIEPGTRVTPEQHEMLIAQRRHLLQTGELRLSGNLQFFGRVLLVLAMVMTAVFYIRLEDRASLKSNGRLGLLALVVVLNLTLVRATYALGAMPYFIENPGVATVLPFLAPTALAPLIVAVLIGSGPAMFTALVISLFSAVIFGNRLDLLVIAFAASVVGIFACRFARQRGKVVRAALLAGFTTACFAVLVGMSDQLALRTLGLHAAGGLVTGLLTGIVVVGLIPVLESLFRRTTDITLLELTDYNHPLLRLMQVEAPGSYHHSLMVANLAENAANAIGANPLLCRVCSLFHDIGKTHKPEYFTENQRDRVNPHDERTPSFSALIIKSHVKEGVDLALKYRLPRVVIDVIQQHHGTTLIQYFYHRARTANRDAAVGAGAGLSSPPPCESTYRYDGPKPQFRESAIIFLADSVEAASRSLRKVTPQHLGELIDGIFRDRIEDGQLDECPLTLADIAAIKTSFAFTLLNMLHARIAYPGQDLKPVPAGSADAEIIKQQADKAV